MGYNSVTGFGISCSAGPGPAPIPPAVLAEAMYYFDADYTNNSGDGTIVPSAVDRSASANPIVWGTAGAFGPVYRATRAGGRAAVEFGAAGGILRSLTASGAAWPAWLSGKPAATTEFTVITLLQPRHHLAIYAWSFDNTAASSRSLTARFNSNAYRPQVYGGTTTGVQPTYDAATYWPHITPRVFTTRVMNNVGMKLRFRYDGVNMADIVWAWTGNYDCNAFTLGGQQTFVGQLQYQIVTLGFPRALTDVEVASIELYLGQAYIPIPYKSAWGATGNWHILSGKGQSNGTGYCQGSPDYTETDIADCYYMSLDGWVYPIAARTHSGINKVPPSLAYPGTVGPSKYMALCAELRTLGDTRPKLVLANELISTTSQGWAIGVAANPPDINTVAGHAKHRALDALLAPGATITIVLDQGEANSNTALDAAQWPVDWDTAKAQDNIDYAGRWDKASAHYILSELSQNISGVGAFIGTVRANQVIWAGANADVTIYQRPDGSCEAVPGLHLNGVEQQVNGHLASMAY